MTDQIVRTSVAQDGCATVTLNRPEVHNAFDDQLIAQLTHCMRELEANPQVRVIVLAAEGKSFSAGADLNWMKRMARYSEAENLRDAVALGDLMHTISVLRKPVIARVQGPAYGGGVGLVACCDIAIGVPEAKLGLTETRLGLLPAVISPYVIDAIGARQARRWFATAETFDAAEALRIGLLHAVVPADALDDAVNRQLDLLLRAGPHAASEAKALVRRVAASHDRDKLGKDNADLIARLRVSREGQEGIGAFLEKRKPAWAP